MRSVPGQNFKFVWNPDASAFNELGYNVALAYPANSYVDYIGLDAYDQTWVTPQTPSNAWNVTLFPALASAQQFAQEQGKPLAVPEWGVATRDDGHGLGDDPRYVNAMIGWMEDPANNVAYESYFDYDSNAQEDAITDGDFPHSLFAFSSDFSGSASPSTVDTAHDNTTATQARRLQRPRQRLPLPPTPPTTTTTRAVVGYLWCPRRPGQSRCPHQSGLGRRLRTGSLNTSLWAPTWFGNTEQQNGTTMSASNVSVDDNGLELNPTAANGTGGMVSSNPDDGQPGHTGFQIAPECGQSGLRRVQGHAPAARRWACGQLARLVAGGAVPGPKTARSTSWRGWVGSPAGTSSSARRLVSRVRSLRPKLATMCSRRPVPTRSVSVDDGLTYLCLRRPSRRYLHVQRDRRPDVLGHGELPRPVEPPDAGPSPHHHDGALRPGLPGLRWQRRV